VTPEQRRARGYAAKALIDDPTLQAAWTELENDLRAQWETSLLPRKRDRIWAELKHLRALRGKLASFAGHARD
jgi:hypothetical protein